MEHQLPSPSPCVINRIDNLFDNQIEKISEIKLLASDLMDSISNNEYSESTKLHKDLVNQESLTIAKNKLEETILWAIEAYTIINTKTVDKV